MRCSTRAFRHGVESHRVEGRRTAHTRRRRRGDSAEAVAASELTLINVVDHDAVDAVLEAAGEAVDGRVIVGLSSDTAERARQTAKLVEDRGGRYLDGAIMTPTTTIGTPSASILFAGPRDRFDSHREVFAALGERPGSARTTAAPPPSTCRCSICSGRRSAGSSMR